MKIFGIFLLKSYLPLDYLSSHFSTFYASFYPPSTEWVAGLKQMAGNFMNPTNNQLVRINEKLKQVIEKHSTLESFLEDFFLILTTIRNRQLYKTVHASQKALDEHSVDLTVYAFSFVNRQIELFRETTYDFTSDTTQQGVYHTYTPTDGDIRVTSSSCTCCYFYTMSLPCVHIFHIRNKLGVSLMDESLCGERWTASYARAARSGGLPESVECRDETTVTVTPQNNFEELSSQQKYSKAMEVCKKVAVAVASSSSEECYEQRLKQLETLLAAWQEDREVDVQVYDDNFEDASAGADNNDVIVLSPDADYTLGDSEIYFDGSS